jgi:predicted ABC-type sugar transport system permease subunit
MRIRLVTGLASVLILHAAAPTFVGIVTGAALSLGCLLIRCVPQGAAGQHVECSGRVPVVMIGAGAAVGLVSGLASGHCRSTRTEPDAGPALRSAPAG